MYLDLMFAIENKFKLKCLFWLRIVIVIIIIIIIILFLQVDIR